MPLSQTATDGNSWTPELAGSTGQSDVAALVQPDGRLAGSAGRPSAHLVGGRTIKQYFTAVWLVQPVAQVPNIWMLQPDDDRKR